MKKILCSLLIVSMLTPLPLVCAEDGLLEVEAVYGTPTIDGNAESLWNSANEYDINKYITEYNGAYGTVKLMWDETHLYILADVKDFLLSTVSDAAYMQDSVEIFLNEDNNRIGIFEFDDAQYRVSCENELSFGNTFYSDKIISAVSTSDSGYIVEAAIDFRACAAKVGSVMGFEIQINDDSEGTGNRDSIAMLCDTSGSSYINTNDWAMLTLTAGKSDFTDVSDSEYADVIAIAEDLGFINGYGDGTFAPEQDITAEEFNMILSRVNNISVEITAGMTRAEAVSLIYNVYFDAINEQVLEKKQQDSELKSYDKELITASGAKQIGNSNPLYTQRFGADPYCIEYDGRIYVYMSGDRYMYDSNGNILENDYSNINTISIISSTDMVNWEDHGEIVVGGKTNANGAAAWAANSWAPAVAHKVVDGKDKFYLYFADNASGIGVLESDNPTGPFTDILKKPLIDSSTPGTDGVEWFFDPAVLVDDDGSAYLYFGGGIPSVDGVEQTDHPKSVRVIKLGDDMMSTEGEAIEIDAPAVFEDSGINKYNGKYYYSYCTNFSGSHEDGKYPYGAICYMISNSPTGPFEYGGVLFDNIYDAFGIGGNNHHCIFEFNGKWYMAYHSQLVSNELGIIQGYRSSHIDELTWSEEGTILPVQASRNGVSQLSFLNPYKETSAATIAWLKGITTERIDGEMVVTEIDTGDYLALSGVDFGDGASLLTVSVLAEDNSTIEIHLDSVDGILAGIVNISASDGKFEEFICDISNAVGIHDVYFVFNSSEIKWKSWRFDSLS